MANRFTTKIDEIFQKYGKDTDKYIFLGCCHQGDDDGGCGEYDYFYITDLMEKLENFDEDKGVIDPYPYDNDNDESAMARYKSFKEEFKVFHDELRSAFPNFFKPDYEGTNCCWDRCYFATRDHKLFQVTTSDWDPKDNSWEMVTKLDELDDTSVDENADKDNLAEIADHVRSIKNRLKELKTPKGQGDALQMITRLSAEFVNSMVDENNKIA